MHTPHPLTPSPSPHHSAAALALVATLLVGACATSAPVAPQRGTEESSGWTDARQDEAIRIWVIAHPGGTQTTVTIDAWVQASSGNERAGSGPAQTGSEIQTEQTPTGTLQLPAIP